MSKLLAEHWPHLIFVAIGVVAFLWTAYRPEREDDRVRTSAARVSDLPWASELAAPASTPAPANVRRSAARRGLLALGPLLGAVATGAVLYGIDVGGGSLPGAVIWVHAGISTLALLLVVYKIADLGKGRLRRAFTRERLHDLVSVGLVVISVPLALTGVVLLFAPSAGSFLAYTHLISSAWWTGLLAWHLRRYMGASLRATFTGNLGAAPAGGASSKNRADLLLEGRDVAGDDVPRSVGVPG